MYLFYKQPTNRSRSNGGRGATFPEHANCSIHRNRPVLRTQIGWRSNFSKLPQQMCIESQKPQRTSEETHIGRSLDSQKQWNKLMKNPL